MVSIHLSKINTFILLIVTLLHVHSCIAANKILDLPDSKINNASVHQNNQVLIAFFLLLFLK